MRICFLCLIIAAICPRICLGQVRPGEEVDRWLTVTEQAAGVNANAKDEAEKLALRKAVEQACGVFLTGQSKTKDYKAVYDKALANTAGYVLEFKTLKVAVDKDAGVTAVTVKARVSTKKFEENWASIAHTLHQENNPRVVVGIVDEGAEEGGAVQAAVEDFFASKGVSLMDKDTSIKVKKRDLLLASQKEDASEVAAVGARFKADVVVVGKASAKIGKEFYLEGQRMYQYTGSLTVRVVQTDSARVLVSKTYSKNYNEFQRRAEDKVMGKVGKEFAPEILSAMVEAWAKRANVTRTVELNISGMDYDTWKAFKSEAEKLRGMQALRLREITESVANIDAEYEFSNENLADRLSEMKDVKLKITEITSNRIKLKVVKE